jgi:hypothetical protein
MRLRRRRISPISILFGMHSLCASGNQHRNQNLHHLPHAPLQTNPASYPVFIADNSSFSGWHAAKTSSSLIKSHAGKGNKGVVLIHYRMLV